MKIKNYRGDPAEVYARRGVNASSSARPNALNVFIREQAEAIVHMLRERLEDHLDKPWLAPPRLPQNACSGYRYTRGNMVMLMAVMAIKKYTDPRFLTLNQCTELGGQIRAGERGTDILRPILRRVRSEQDEEPASRPTPSDGEGNPPAVEEKYCDTFVAFRALRVFNVEQCTGLRLKPLLEIQPRNWDDDPLLENFLQAYRMPVRHTDYRAFYNRLSDEITMPPKDCFPSSSAYYAVLAHEAFHSTGHPDRENREAALKWGDDKYAMEELRAELFSSLTNSYFGLGYPPQKNAAYLQNWLEALDDNPKLIFQAAKEASSVFEALVDFSEDTQPKLPWFPDRAIWPHLKQQEAQENTPLSEPQAELEDAWAPCP